MCVNVFSSTAERFGSLPEGAGWVPGQVLGDGSGVVAGMVLEPAGHAKRAKLSASRFSTFAAALCCWGYHFGDVLVISYNQS